MCGIPELSTLVLVALATCGFVVYRRHRKTWGCRASYAFALLTMMWFVGAAALMGLTADDSPRARELAPAPQADVMGLPGDLDQGKDSASPILK